MPVHKSLFDHYREICGEVLQSEGDCDRFFKKIAHENADMATRLSVLVAEAELTLPNSLFIGVVPHCRVNAQVVLLEEGYLILVNEGLLRFAYSLATLLACSFKAVSGGKLLDPLISILDARYAYMVLSDAFFYGQGFADIYQDTRFGSIAEKLNVPPERGRMLSNLYDGLIDYVIAHELAHVVLGHLSVPNRQPVDLTLRYAGALSHQDELEADLEAAKYITASNAKDSVQFELRLQGAVAFFECIEWGWWASTLGTSLNPGSLTHPSPEGRRAAVVCDMFPRSFLSRVPRLDHIVVGMADLRGQAVDSVISPAHLSQSLHADVDRRIREYRPGDLPMEFMSIFVDVVERGVSVFNCARLFERFAKSFESALHLTVEASIFYLRCSPSTNYVGKLYGVISALFMKRLYANYSDYPEVARLIRDVFGDLTYLVEDLEPKLDFLEE